MTGLMRRIAVRLRAASPARRLLLLAVLLGLVTAAVLVPLFVTDNTTSRRPVSAARADELARQSCRLAAQLIDEVSANAKTKDVLALADRVQRAADDAAYSSPQWVLLDGAVQALVHALHVDDAELAATGMQEIGPACTPTGVVVR